MIAITSIDDIPSTQPCYMIAITSIDAIPSTQSCYMIAVTSSISSIIITIIITITNGRWTEFWSLEEVRVTLSTRRRTDAGTAIVSAQ